MKQWLFDKILSYLVSKEGYEVNPEDTEVSNDSIRTIMQDAFGFRYEIKIKTLGRLQGTGFGDLEMKTGSFLSVGGDLDAKSSNC